MVVETRTGAGRDEHASPNTNVVEIGTGLDIFIPTILHAKEQTLLLNSSIKHSQK